MLNLNVRNNNKIAKKLDGVPYGVRGRACEAAAFALMGNKGNTAKGLQYYPPRVSSYVRTYDLRFGWKAQKWGDGTKIKITNTVPYTPFVQGDSEQAWMHKGIWRKTSKIISDNQSVMDNAIDKEVKKYLKEKGL